MTADDFNLGTLLIHTQNFCTDDGKALFEGLFVCFVTNGSFWLYLKDVVCVLTCFTIGRDYCTYCTLALLSACRS